MTLRLVTLILVLGLGVGSHPVLAQQEGSGDPAGTVNVEIILDVSGSMAQALESGETRMDAAKQVLEDVTALIPETEGVNVGLRVYGHEGDNTDEGKAESCESSELVVPIKGVDKEQLINEVQALQPTGWTPLGLSLERSEKDFKAANDETNNVVILITDGLETCDTDPCEVAGDINTGDRKITTHVIGFALTAEEQEIISCIAEQGGGDLFSADSSAELSSSVFTVLEELEIVTGNGFIGGNAFSLVPAGESGELSVVAYGTPDPYGAGLPVIIRNNTSKEVVGVTLNATARDADGSLLGAGDGQTIQPFRIVPNGLAIAQVYFGGTEIPPDAEYEFDLEPIESSEARFRSEQDLEIVEAELFEDRIVGTFENTSEETITNGITASSVCLDEEGTVLGYDLGFVETGELAPGETVSFQITLLSSQISGNGCPAFLVAGSGYAD